MRSSRRGELLLPALVVLTGISIPARTAAAAVPTKVSPTSVSIDEQFSLTVEVPSGCDMASINSNDFAIVTSRDFHAARQYRHLQPTGHVHELTPGFSNYSGFNQSNTQLNNPADELRSPAHTRSYVLKANRSGTLTLGPFQVLCPDGPQETQVQTVEIRDRDDSPMGKVVGIQDFSPARSAPAAAPPALNSAALATPANVSPAPAAPAEEEAPDLVGRLSALFSERNLLVLTVIGLAAAVVALLLRGPEKKS